MSTQYWHCMYTCLFITKAGLKSGVERQLSQEFLDFPWTHGISVDGEHFTCMGPSEEEMMFYDVLIQNQSTVGLTLRLYEECGRSEFLKYTESIDYITWDVDPTVWLTESKVGTAAPNGIELFGDIFLCRNSSIWILLIPSITLHGTPDQIR